MARQEVWHSKFMYSEGKQMICSNCNREIEDGSRFCEFCGAPQQGGQPSGQPMNEQAPQQGGQPSGQPVNGQASQQGGQPSGQPVNGQAQQAGQPMGGQIPPVNGQPPMPPKPPRQPMSSATKKMIAAVAAVGVVIGIILVVVLNRKTTINLQDYVKVKFDGYDTVGTASIEFDDDAFYEDVKKSRKVKKEMEKAGALDIEDSEDWEELAEAMQSAMSAYSFASGLDWKLDKDEKLSNGDKVTVTFAFDNEKAAESGIKFLGEKAEFTVKGLKKVKEVDPMADITVEFSGTSPECSAEVVNNSTEEVLQDVYYQLSKSYDIAKGEKVTVSVDYDEDMEEYYLAQYGCKLTNTSKEFTCDKVDEYVSKIQDIDADAMAKIQKQASDVINAYFADAKDSFVAGKINFEGCYFLAAKDLSTWGSKNILYVVYSSEVKGKKKGSFKKTKVFLPVKFTDVLKYADGTVYVDLNVNSIEGYTDLYCGFNTLRGFTKKEIMLNDLVASEASEYTYEASDNLK